MSLILEALKKSEAERRVGQPPGLLSPVIATAPPRRAAWRWVALAAVPALLAGAWWFGRQSVPEAPPAALAVAEAPSAPRVAPPSAEVEAAPARAVAVPPPATQDTRTVAGARPAPAPAPALRVPPVPGSDAATTERESQAMSVEAAEALLRAQQAPASVPSARAGPPAAPVRLQSPVAAGSAAPPMAGAEAAVAAERLPELRALAPALRADLPPLKVSMHVFDADPARRFTIIDGRRVGEGDVLGRELWLIEIRREGSVLRYRDERFLLPRPG